MRRPHTHTLMTLAHNCRTFIFALKYAAMRSIRLNSIFCCLFLLFFACTSSAQNAVDDAAQKKIDEQKLQEYFQKHDIHPKKGPGGIYYTITKEGVGRQILAGETVTMNYTGKLLDGTIFDSNIDSDFHHTEPFVVEIGARKVIKGWDKGVPLLKKGSVATLYIPSRMAYGPEGGPHIPENSVLIFDIEVTDVTK